MSSSREREEQRAEKKWSKIHGELVDQVGEEGGLYRTKNSCLDPDQLFSCKWVSSVHLL